MTTPPTTRTAPRPPLTAASVALTAPSSPMALSTPSPMRTVARDTRLISAKNPPASKLLFPNQKSHLSPSLKLIFSFIHVLYSYRSYVQAKLSSTTTLLFFFSVYHLSNKSGGTACLQSTKNFDNDLLFSQTLSSPALKRP